MRVPNRTCSIKPNSFLLAAMVVLVNSFKTGTRIFYTYISYNVTVRKGYGMYCNTIRGEAATHGCSLSHAGVQLSKNSLGNICLKLDIAFLLLLLLISQVNAFRVFCSWALVVLVALLNDTSTHKARNTG